MKTVPTVIEKISALVPSLTEQLGALRKTQAETNTRISELNAERKQLLASPITAEDYAELICIQIDRVADKYRDAAAANLLSQAGGTAQPSSPAKVHLALRMMEAKEPPSGTMLGHIRDHSERFEFDNDPLRQFAATFIMRDEMKNAAGEIAAAAGKRWPYMNAKPMRETIARIKEIDVELAALGVDKQALDDAATSLQISTQTAPSAAE